MTIKLSKFILTISLFALLLTACGRNSVALEGTAWQLIDFAGKPLDSAYRPTISFEAGRVGGNSSCNTYGGDYTIKGDKIEFGMMMSTKMACLEDEMNQEQAFLAFLAEVERYEVQDGQLHLFNAAGDVLLFDPQD